ncbi:MAG: shikimate dehydrogenase [Anaerovoracaceae bacterium]|jgi:shikimate dehydrogenase
MKNIVLTGLPGSGKTTIGKHLSRIIGLPFFDLDAEIEQSESMNIGEIFNKLGEEGFRRIEADQVRRISSKEGIILATGGGTIKSPDNMKLLSGNGFIVFIDRSLEDILKDLETSNRPLLKDNPRALIKLDAERRNSYVSTADYIYKGSHDPCQIAKIIGIAWLALNSTGYGVIGDPIAHSLSPEIHGIAFKLQDISAQYNSIQVPEDSLEVFIRATRKGELKGLNVTAPHKQAIIPFLDEISYEAKLCGAVNTVSVQNHRLYGHNTDMEGFSRSLAHRGHPITNKGIVILGAGGASRAVAIKAGLEKAKNIHIVARDPIKAKNLSEYVEDATGVPSSFSGWSTNEISEACRDSNILVNATPLGMMGIDAAFEDLSFLSKLPKDGLVCDLIYSPPQTCLLKEASRLGLDGLNGFPMLVFQALLAQEIFLDKKIHISQLYKSISEYFLSQRKGLMI